MSEEEDYHKPYYQWADEMCALVDELAKKHISTDTPLFRYQQSMIQICRKYREDCKKEIENGE